MRTSLHFVIASSCALLALFFPAAIQAYFTTFERIPYNTITLDDWTPPQTKLLFFSPRLHTFLPITELITNSTFADGTAGWLIEGNIISAENGIQLGGENDTSTQQHCISQLIPNIAKTLSFAYTVFTTESTPGFDDPAFEATINKRPVFHLRAEDIVDGRKDETAVVQLDRFSEETLLIKFCAGNTGDNLSPSWAVISNVSTLPIFTNSLEQFSLKADDLLPTTSHLVLSDGPLDVNGPFDFPDGNGIARYWSEDTSGNTETSADIEIHANSKLPKSISNIAISPQGDGEYVLQFPTPQSQNTLAYYDVRVSADLITPETDLDILPLAQQPPESIHDPREEGVMETLFLEDISPDLSPQPHFVVRSVDVYRNISDPQTEEMWNTSTSL